MLATQDVCVSNDLLRMRLLERRRVIDLQELAFAREAAEFAAGDAWEEEGSVSAIDWIRFNCHMTAGAAANAVAVGEALPRLPESHQAVVDSEIGFAHLAVMARTAQALGERFDEKLLIEKARGSSPGKFFYICHHARHAFDPKAYAALQAEQVEQRRLKLSTWMDPIATGRRRGARHITLVHWIHGGSTDLDNLVLLCHRHHWMVHEGKWQIVRGDDGRMLTIPPIVMFGPSP